MAQTINTNVASLNAQRNLSASQNSLGTTLQRLSSGLRVNSAEGRCRWLGDCRTHEHPGPWACQVVIRNANDGISLGADGRRRPGARSATTLQRMRELAVQSAERHQRQTATAPCL